MQEPISILLADLVHPGNQLKTFPYAAGCVGSYVAAELGERVSVEIVRFVEELDEALRERPPAILGLTHYLWNAGLGDAVSRRARAVAPDTIVVMGGPHYSDEPAAQRRFFAQHPQVDFYVVKEGEVPFARLVSELAVHDLDALALKESRIVIPGVHYEVAGELLNPATDPRVRGLDRFPSPYLTGLLDRFFDRSDLAPLLQSKRGCPFRCTFCVEGESYYTKLGSGSTEKFRAELEYIAERVNGPEVLFIADSNFGMYPQDLELCDVIADVRQRYDWPRTIDVSTGKNRKERILEAVRRTGGAMRFGPALQSTAPEVLRNVRRANISEAALLEMAGSASQLGQRSYTELILGLPGETAGSHLGSIRAAMSAGIQRIKMYPLVLLPGTEMATPRSREQYGIESRFRVLPQSHGTYRFCEESFPCVEVVEIVVGTHAMTFEEYIRCRRFQLSVEIFYNDLYLEEAHGLARRLGLSMFDVVERCHARQVTFPPGLRALYDAVEAGVRESLWPGEEACREHHRVPGNRERYAATEYRNSLGILKALALLDEIGAVLDVLGEALHESLRESEHHSAALHEYIDELVEYARLRRQDLLTPDAAIEGRFRFAFDQITRCGFDADPGRFRLSRPRPMRFWHDDGQARALRRLRENVASPLLRARDLVYPPSDPAVNPYLRHAAFQ